jgi:hypothetical protein
MEVWTPLAVDFTNAELEALIKKENIVRFIKSHRLQWAAHVIRMDHLRTVKKLMEWELCLSRPVGKPRQMDRPSGRGFKEDESEKLERELQK